jgi:hypothetical protein
MNNIIIKLINSSKTQIYNYNSFFCIGVKIGIIFKKEHI